MKNAAHYAAEINAQLPPGQSSIVLIVDREAGCVSDIGSRVNRLAIAPLLIKAARDFDPNNLLTINNEEIKLS